MATMESPNIIARSIALARRSLPCIKKLTVMGIMGNTQGVSKASRPSPKASQKNPQSEPSCPVTGTDAMRSPDSSVPSPVKVSISPGTDSCSPVPVSSPIIPCREGDLSPSPASSSAGCSAPGLSSSPEPSSTPGPSSSPVRSTAPGLSAAPASCSAPLPGRVISMENGSYFGGKQVTSSHTWYWISPLMVTGPGPFSITFCLSLAFPERVPSSIWNPSSNFTFGLVTSSS